MIICGWFVDNKLSIQSGEDKTKSILFSSKNRKMKIGALDIQYGDVKIKQDSKVTCLGCELSLSEGYSFDHSILLGKLKHYGIRGVAYSWFGSYLKDRKQ